MKSKYPAFSCVHAKNLLLALTIMLVGCASPTMYDPGPDKPPAVAGGLPLTPPKVQPTVTPKPIITPKIRQAREAFIQNRYPEAIALLREELMKEEAKTKINGLQISLLQKSLGDTFQKTEQYNPALEYYQKSLAIILKQLGSDHIHVAASYHNIGQVHNAKGEYDKALEYYQKSLAIKLKKLGPDHPDVALSYNNIGAVHDNKGEYDQALEFYQKSLAINLKQRGPDHPSVATSYHNLAYVYKAKKDLPKAREYWEKAYAIKFKKLGPNHPSTRRTKAGLDELAVEFEKK